MENLMRVKIMHPTENRTVDVDIPDDMTVQDVIDELIESDFIKPLAGGNKYDAVLKDGPEAVNMDLNKTLQENGVGNNSTIRLNNGTGAGSGRK